MASMDELRQGVCESLPEVNEIKNEELRRQVIEAWAFALSQSEFTRIDQIRGSGVPDSPALKDGTQAEHLRGVARMAQGLADGLEEVHGDLGIDRDLLWACALCHDVASRLSSARGTRRVGGTTWARRGFHRSGIRCTACMWR